MKLKIKPIKPTRTTETLYLTIYDNVKLSDVRKKVIDNLIQSFYELSELSELSDDNIILCCEAIDSWCHLEVSVTLPESNMQFNHRVGVYNKTTTIYNNWYARNEVGILREMERRVVVKKERAIVDAEKKRKATLEKIAKLERKLKRMK